MRFRPWELCLSYRAWESSPFPKLRIVSLYARPPLLSNSIVISSNGTGSKPSHPYTTRAGRQASPRHCMRSRVTSASLECGGLDAAVCGADFTAPLNALEKCSASPVKFATEVGALPNGTMAAHATPPRVKPRGSKAASSRRTPKTLRPGVNGGRWRVVVGARHAAGSLPSLLHSLCLRLMPLSHWPAPRPRNTASILRWSVP